MNSKIFEGIWVPETEAELREFEAFAETCAGPNPLYRRVYLKNPLRSSSHEGVTWDDYFRSPNIGEVRTPKDFARALVEVTRRWDLPAWDRRSLRPKPTLPARSVTVPTHPPTSSAGYRLN
jgi:hypothetical protein